MPVPFKPFWPKLRMATWSKALASASEADVVTRQLLERSVGSVGWLKIGMAENRNKNKSNLGRASDNTVNFLQSSMSLGHCVSLLFTVFCALANITHGKGMSSSYAGRVFFSATQTSPKIPINCLCQAVRHVLQAILGAIQSSALSKCEMVENDLHGGDHLPSPFLVNAI